MKRAMVLLLLLISSIFATGQLYIDAGKNLIYLDEAYIGSGSKLLDLEPKNYHLVIKNSKGSDVTNELINVREGAVTRIETQKKSTTRADEVVELQMKDTQHSVKDLLKKESNIDVSQFDEKPKYSQNFRKDNGEKKLSLELAGEQKLSNAVKAYGGIGFGYDFDPIKMKLLYFHDENSYYAYYNLDIDIKVYTNYLILGANIKKDRTEYKVGIGIPILPVMSVEAFVTEEFGTQQYYGRVAISL